MRIKSLPVIGFSVYLFVMLLLSSRFGDARPCANSNKTCNCLGLRYKVSDPRVISSSTWKYKYIISLTEKDKTGAEINTSTIDSIINFF